MQTAHKIVIGNSQKLTFLKDNSIDLVVTSPPYPMIKMWDNVFNEMNSRIDSNLIESDSQLAFELMHQELDKVWGELSRVLKPGGFVCINIGDAARSTDGFSLFSNSARIINKMTELNFSNLPPIIWMKTTNSPTKFMGSGMLPAGAYVTLENEYILIFRKGQKRVFKNQNSHNRYESAYFWSERNVWFSSFWKLPGVRQQTKNGEKRERNGAYPLELPWRLINMFSVYGDNVLDPFLGTGTTALASMMSARNSYSVEIDETILNNFQNNKKNLIELTRSRYLDRINDQSEFIKSREKKPNYYNENLGIHVMTSQETKIRFFEIDSIENYAEGYKVEHTPIKLQEKLF